MSGNLCSWRDANRFFGECAVFSGDDEIEQYRTLDLAHRLESPLEYVMLCAILAAKKRAKVTDKHGLMHNRQVIRIRPAHPVGRYRADFLVTAENHGVTPAFAPVVVECDGFNYHDRTREQARYDRERDRYMLHRGLLVMRFTGEEITEAPFSCAAEVLSLAHGNVIHYDRDDPQDGEWPVFRRSCAEGDDDGPPPLRLFRLQKNIPEEAVPLLEAAR